MIDTQTCPGHRVLLVGGTGTIGRATASALMAAGHDVTALVRPGADATGLPACTVVEGAVTDSDDRRRTLARGFDAVVSCLASRTGAPKDAWAIDYKAHSDLLADAQVAGIGQFVLLSAICVQKPLLAFQQAKLAFEEELRASGLTWSIVRPTAFFKSLSGQIDRLKAGKPFLVFGNGELTACKPISDADLGRYVARCLSDPDLQNRILPIGGPGPALTPLDQAQMLFDLMGQKPSVRHVSPRVLDGIIAVLGLAGRVSGKAAEKAELARIGRYYATESMLVLDPATGRYDADATPEFGEDTLYAHYQKLLRGEVADDRGAHAVF
ncbi:Divinyl protochlorophyllide a 8-vinyl-reductase [Roseibacterium elongatum DSM 19469]|uniref:Divinyl chlorophyllide a 8-vinyl-reductase, chloroplastic n=1 Tax=Roseicyclus elongatus DSM 19469 TaxID=1294273 RepID=W8RZB2_9RHOB|nr:NAD(P)H-binding protein [Roseibacterium elongatum]AHM03217.1 Divinyl protochlorophyllide a 8-vinyl-reductase [Roseibacterium elongatum DSM 19469]